MYISINYVDINIYPLTMECNAPFKFEHVYGKGAISNDNIIIIIITTNTNTTEYYQQLSFISNFKVIVISIIIADNIF